MARKLLFLLPAALFAVLLGAFAVGLRHDPHLLPSALIDRPAPDFALPGLYESAEGLTRKDLEGRVTLVNFFASWCAPCREEHPQLMALAQPAGVTLDGIAYKDKPEDSRRFLDRLGNPYRHVGVDRAGTTAIDFGVYGVPETYVVDGTGHVRYRHVGPLTAEDVKSEDSAADRAADVLGRRAGSSGQAGVELVRDSGSGSRSSLETAARKPRQIAPAIGGRLDRRAADRERLSAHLAGAEPLVKETRRVVAQHPKDRRTAPRRDEAAEQRDQQPAPDPLVLPVRGDVEREHLAGERSGRRDAARSCRSRGWRRSNPTATRTSRGSRRMTLRQPASRRRSDSPTR